DIVDPPGPPGCADEGNMPLNYTFGLDDLSATTFTAQAVPTETFAARDKQCGTLSLGQAGAGLGGLATGRYASRRLSMLADGDRIRLAARPSIAGAPRTPGLAHDHAP